MKILKSITIFKTSLIFSCLLLTTCTKREETVHCFPETNIDVILQLNLPSYVALQNIGGWIYVNEQESGTKGLIIVRTINGFLAYDRNAPHICPNENSTLKVENDIKIVCPSDGAEWILITGEPVSIANIPPKRYFVDYNVNDQILTISN